MRLSSWRCKPQTQIQWVPGEVAALAAARWSAQCEGRARQRHPAHGDGHCWHTTQPSDFRENTLPRAMGWTGNSVSVSADGFTAWTTLTQSSCCQDPRWVGRGAPAASPAAQRNEWRLNMERSLGYQPTQAVPPRGTEQPPTRHKDTRIITFLISADTKLGTIQKWWEKKVPSNVCTVIRKPPVFCHGLFRVENTPLL